MSVLKLMVSIPFIAGQWSLPTHTGNQREGRRSGLNPLHCGAVVASARGGIPRGEARCGLNPLHCGAVVASRGLRGPRPTLLGVSIPFIAGQWSLLPAMDPERGQRLQSQSPSLRGSGRFGWARRKRNEYHLVSIPFIAGQWSLLTERLPPPKFRGGQNRRVTCMLFP